MRHTTAQAAIAIILGAGAAAGLTADALAQNALGDGRALDANLRVGSGGRNEAGRDFRSELEFRNALVTGNVAGGKSFRGEVGYTAANDFRGVLGSDDIYAFERDSFYSGLATRNLAGLDSFQTSFGYSVAGQSMSYFGGPLIINRGGSAVSAGEVTGEAAPVTRTDVYGNLVGSMRSPSIQALRVAEGADLVAYATPEGGETYVISASSLLGVKVLPASSAVLNPGKRVSNDLSLDIPMAPSLGSDPLIDPDHAPDDTDDEPIERPNAVSAHQRILNAFESDPLRVEMAQQATLAEPDRALDQPQPGQTPEDTPVAGPGPGPDTLTDLDRLRIVLSQRSPAAPPPPTDPVGGDLFAEPEVDPFAPVEEEPAAESDDARTLAQRVLDVDLPPVDHLINRETSNIVYRRHMTRGEALLGEARWFLAEERFTAALAIIPGDPMAAAGRVHAQIGAGMFLSAAVNLRNLLRAYPEFIPVRFNEELLPRGDRLDVLQRQLRQRAELDTNIGRDSALLLAYLGHQFDQPDVTREGFEKLERIESALSIEPDPLNDAIKAIWIEEGR